MAHTITKRAQGLGAALLFLGVFGACAVAAPAAYAADASAVPAGDKAVQAAAEDASAVPEPPASNAPDEAPANAAAAAPAASEEPNAAATGEGAAEEPAPAEEHAAIEEPAPAEEPVPAEEPAAEEPAAPESTPAVEDPAPAEEPASTEPQPAAADDKAPAAASPSAASAPAASAPTPSASSAPVAPAPATPAATTRAKAPAKAPAKAASAAADIASLITTTKKKDGTLEVTGLSSSANITSLVIPATIDGVKVTSIAAAAFKGSKLTSITIPGTVTEIGNNAFQGSALTSMVIPKSVKTLGTYLFESCESLATLTVKAKLDYIPAYFATSSGVKTVKIAAGPLAFGLNSFADCKSLTSVTVPKGVSELLNGTFYKCTSLKKIKLPSTLRIIDAQCFDGCSKLTVTMPYGVCLADQYAFRGVKKLGKVPSYLAHESGVYCRIDQVTVAGLDDYGQAWALLDRENAYRKAHKLGALKMDKSLLSDAMNKAAGLTTQFRAMLPSSTSADVVVYVAKGCDTVAQAMKLWQKSYKTNNAIADKKMLYTGIGCFVWGQNRYWVQYFAPKGGYKSKAAAKRSSKQKSMQHTSRFWMDDGYYVLDLARASASKYAKSKAYAGGKTTQKATVKYLTSDKPMPLFEGYDYRIAYRNNKKVGTASFTLKPVTSDAVLHNTGKNASAAYSFAITAASIAKAKATVTTQAYRKGKAAEPKLASITYKGQALKLGRDYRIVKYGNNAKPTKKAWVQIQGKGNYKGMKKVYFTIA